MQNQITIEILNKFNQQFSELENCYLSEIGEPILSDERKTALKDAIETGEITFFVAKRNSRLIGMCSVATAFSTFSCSKVATFEDFYIEPVFRKKGVARMLSTAAQEWCKKNMISSLTVCCAPCDEKMYNSLGFDVPLGKTFAKIL